VTMRASIDRPALAEHITDQRDDAENGTGACGCDGARPSMDDRGRRLSAAPAVRSAALPYASSPRGVPSVPGCHAYGGRPWRLALAACVRSRRPPGPSDREWAAAVPPRTWRTWS